jgi:hypothetical protein
VADEVTDAAPEGGWLIRRRRLGQGHNGVKSAFGLKPALDVLRQLTFQLHYRLARDSHGAEPDVRGLSTVGQARATVWAEHIAQLAVCIPALGTTAPVQCIVEQGLRALFQQRHDYIAVLEDDPRFQRGQDQLRKRGWRSRI